VQNNAEALQWYQDADTPCALNYAGICYANGRGVIKSASGAAAKYREAAVRGDANAQFNLGCMYKTCAYGPGAVQDDPTEQRWCRLVGHGSIESLREDGYGAEQDVPLAIRFAARWFGLAASQGHAGAQASIDLLLGEGHSLEQDVPWLCGGVEQDVPSWQHCNPSWEYRVGPTHYIDPRGPCWGFQSVHSSPSVAPSVALSSETTKEWRHIFDYGCGHLPPSKLVDPAA